jgi:CBS domain-containing protein
MRPTITCPAEDSLGRSVDDLRRNGGFLPVVSDGVLIGVLTEDVLLNALANDTDLVVSCGSVARETLTIPPYASGAEAFRLLSETDMPTLVVVDDMGHVAGLLSPSDLYPRRRTMPRPPTVGGMATPFGVYLTSGGLRGGVSLYAVMATGAVMFVMMIASVAIASLALSPLGKTTLSETVQVVIANVTALALFLAMMRLAPLSGTHGAEHMTVHAMERGEPLTPEVVARMPRVHPRCGTNLAVAIGLFFAISQAPWIEDYGSRLVVGAIVTLFLWKPLGSFAQQYITTRKPNERQLRSGIKAGNELIEQYAVARFSTASIPTRIWNSGLLHVIAGSTVAGFLLWGLEKLFHFTLPGFSAGII